MRLSWKFHQRRAARRGSRGAGDAEKRRWRKLGWLFCVLGGISQAIAGELIDLEDLAQDFVLEVKKIEIPGYPIAFNPSIIRWKDLLLMSFRVIPDRKSSFTSRLGLVWLDEEFNPIGEPQLLELRGPYSSVPCRAEDGRLIEIGGRLYLVYSDNIEPKISKGGFRVFVAELRLRGGAFSLENIECLSRFEGESRAVREKNWPPFDYKGEFFLAYSLLPHRIFRYLRGSGTCETIASTSSSIEWDWGELRGGTTALREGDEYLSFFHSWKDMGTLHSDGKVMSHYYMGAYTFSSEPPFAITRISPEPIVGKNFYHGPIYKPYWKQVRVVFPGGFVSNDKFIWVTYGRQDHEAWVVKLDKKKLLKSLVPTSVK